LQRMILVIIQSKPNTTANFKSKEGIEK